MTKRISGTRLPRLLKRNQSSRGQALIEFSLVALTFFVLVFALIDFSWLFFNQMMMQNAVREAARYASTGDHVTNNGTTLSRVASIEQILQDAAAVGTDIQSIVIKSALGGVGSGGGPGDTVTVQAVCDVPLLTFALGPFFTSNQFTFTVSATLKNEPFPASEE